jgi:hypothetical protein
VWNDLLKVKDCYLAGRNIKIGDGFDTDFWRDPWCGPVALREKFSCLYEICNEQKGSLAGLAAKGWRLTFRRWLDEHAQMQLRQMRDILTSCALGADKDRPMWIWGNKKTFSVKTMYDYLCRTEVENRNRKIWKAKMPLKIKIFMWMVQLNVILTRDTLTRKNWQGDKRCSFCSQDESVQHLFFKCSLTKNVWSLVAMVIGAECRPTNVEQFWFWYDKYLPTCKSIHMVSFSAICWALWRSRNSVCFDKKIIKSPTEIICLASLFMSYWAGLQNGSDKETLETGTAALKEAALAFHPQEEAHEEFGAGVVLLQ